MLIELNIDKILTYLVYILLFDVGEDFQKDDQWNAIKYCKIT